MDLLAKFIGNSSRLLW